MTDEIYNYFSSNASREFEPIEDSDEFEEGLGQSSPDSEEETDDATASESGTASDSASEAKSNLTDNTDKDQELEDLFAAFTSDETTKKVEKSAASGSNPPALESGERAGTGDDVGEQNTTPDPEVKAVETPEPTPVASRSTAPPAPDAAPKKSGGHWDRLANFFGIAGNKSGGAESGPPADDEKVNVQPRARQSDADQATTPTESVVASVETNEIHEPLESDSPIPDNSPVASAKVTSAEVTSAKATSAKATSAKAGANELPGEFFGFRFDDSDPSNILSTAAADRAGAKETVANDLVADNNADPELDPLFEAFASSDSSATAAVSEPEEDVLEEVPAESVNDDFVEFEIEELDDSEVDEEAAAARGRRSRGRRQSASNEVDDDSRTDRPSRRRSRKQNRGRDDEEVARTEDTSANRGRRGKPAGRGKSRRQPADDFSNQQEDFNLQPAADHDADGDSFGFGIMDDTLDSHEMDPQEIDPRDVDPRNGDVDEAPSHRRGGKGRSRGRRGRSRGRDGQDRGQADSRNRNRGSADQRDSRPKSQWRAEEDSDIDLNIVDEMERVDGSDFDENETAEDRPRKRRRRRRGRNRSGQTRDDSSRAVIDDDDDVVEDSFVEDDLDDTEDEFETDSRPRSRGGRSRRGRDSKDRDRGDRSAPPQYGDVPTWYDAIVGVIDGNIKNHGRSQARGRSRGGSRGRSNGDGGERDSGRRDNGGGRGRSRGRNRR